MSSRLKDQYNTEIREAMVKKFGYTNPMQIPKLDKIVVNMAVGEAKENEKLLETAAKDLETITGQQRREAAKGRASGLHKSKEVHCKLQDS